MAIYECIHLVLFNLPFYLFVIYYNGKFEKDVESRTWY